MTDKVQKIREEVVKLKSQLLKGACSSQTAIETRCKEEAYDEVLTLLDSMQEEPKTDWLQELHCKLDSLSKDDFEKVWAKYAQKEEPVSNDLNTELDKYIKEHFTIDKEQLDRFGLEEKDYMYSLDKSDMLILIRHFANWQFERVNKALLSEVLPCFMHGVEADEVVAKLDEVLNQKK